MFVAVVEIAFLPFVRHLPTVGIVVFIHALLEYIAREVGPVEWRVMPDPARRE